MNFKTQTLFNTYGGKSMNQILIKQELNINISKEEFLDDITCMINVLRDCYGMYEYFGENLFLRAEYNIKNYLEANEFIFDEALEFFKKELTFIKDGHFYIGKPRTFKENMTTQSYIVSLKASLSSTVKNFITIQRKKKFN